MVNNPKSFNLNLAELPEIAQKCFPGIFSRQWYYMDEGIGYYTFIIKSNNGKIVFHFPRFNSVVERLLREVELLKNLDLSIKVPNPLFVCSGCTNHPWPFFGYPFIPGVQLTPRIFTEIKSQSIKLSIARQLGQFLSDLHGSSLNKVFKIGFENCDQTGSRVKFWEETRDCAFPLLSTSQRLWTTCHFEGLFSTEGVFDFSLLLTHGDLTDQHILYNPLTNKYRALLTLLMPILGTQPEISLDCKLLTEIALPTG